MPPLSHYTLESWIQDYSWYCSETNRLGPKSASMGIEDLRSYFLSSRTNALNAEYCLNHFIAAIDFLEANVSSLNFGKFVVAGEDRFMVSRPVIETLYRFFSAIPSSELDAFVISVEDFIQVLTESYPTE